MDQDNIRRVAFVGNYLPRKCGIATFTTDICEGFAKAYPENDVFAVPMNDVEEGYAYPKRVRFEVTARELAAFQRAAEFLNINSVDLVCLQHEFGIFGGTAGSHVLKLLSELRMPVVTTMHTVLKEPSPSYMKATKELVQLSDRLIVMSERGQDYLTSIYGVNPEKIDFIHHGIPDVPFVDPSFYKDKFGVEGKKVILTFGLLSPNKGVEYAIEALPEILKRYPNVVYIILGATHPHLKREQGESYRLELQRLVQAKKVQGNVIFVNRFVNLEELVEFIGAADIYVTPYLNEAQITSGTLAYSVGAGKAVVSTPYWYAEELLADGRGRIVPFRDSKAIAKEVLGLLDNEAERHAMRRNAYSLGREMIWSHVSKLYMESFVRAREERFSKPRSAVIKTLDMTRGELPPVNLAHLERMTDDTGIAQHAKFCVPDYEHGYCTDDNARALILSVLLEEIGGAPSTEVRTLAYRYMAFLNHAWNPKTQRFRNFMSYDRRWLEDAGSEDSHGRALWALGVTAGRSKDPGLRGLAGRLFGWALPRINTLESPRAWAFSLIGIMEFMRRFYGHSASQQARATIAERLLQEFKKNATDDWYWFEDILAYCNAKLPHTLILCGQWLGEGEMVDTGLRALHWLVEVQKEGGNHFVPIGCKGFYRKNGERARFDQQPIEAYSTVSACLEAYRMTGEDYWFEEAQRAFEWYLGRNDIQTPLYNHTNGGCFDGLTPDRANQNQGAESTLSFLLSLVEMNMAEHVILPTEGNGAEKDEAPPEE